MKFLTKTTLVFAVITAAIVANFAALKATYGHIVQFEPEISGEPMHAVEIVMALGAKLGETPVGYVGVADAYYLAPDPSAVWDLIKNLEPPLPYKPGVFDCDDYADYFRGELGRRWAARGERLPLPIITVWAVVQYRDGVIGGHAFNGLVLSSGKVIWIEPQGPHIYRRGMKILEITRLTL